MDDDDVPITLVAVTPPSNPQVIAGPSGPLSLRVCPYWMEADSQTLSPFAYHAEYGSPSLSSPMDFSPEYSPSVPLPLSLSPLTGAFRDFSVDDSSPYSINQPLSASSEEFLSPWPHEFPLISSFPKEMNVEGLSLGDSDGFPASPLSGFFFEDDFQLGLHFDAPTVSVDDENLAADDHTDHTYTSNLAVLAPAPRHPPSDSLFPLQDRLPYNRRHSHSNGINSTAVDCVHQLRRIHSATDIPADSTDLYSAVSHPDAVFDDHESQTSWSEPPPPPLSLDPPVSDEANEPPAMDHVPRAKIASEAVLRAAAKRRRKKATFQCYVCGNSLTSKDNLNSE
jgi:hypothetical protein